MAKSAPPVVLPVPVKPPVPVKAPEPPACGNCRFWKQDGSPAVSDNHGDCRRHPPATNLGQLNFVFPQVAADCWCGEYEVRDKKEEKRSV